jgi:hypothetical protein
VDRSGKLLLKEVSMGAKVVNRLLAGAPVLIVSLAPFAGCARATYVEPNASATTTPTPKPRGERGYDRDSFPRMPMGYTEEQFVKENPDAELLGERMVGGQRLTMYDYLYLAPGARIRDHMYYFFRDGKLFQWDSRGRWPTAEEAEAAMPSK